MVMVQNETGARAIGPNEEPQLRSGGWIVILQALPKKIGGEGRRSPRRQVLSVNAACVLKKLVEIRTAFSPRKAAE
jgi:hypothetical protein